MDEYGNPIPGSSKEFENEEILESTDNYDFEWLENEFNHSYVQDQSSEDKNLIESQNYKIEPCPNDNINEFFEEISGIDFSQNNSKQNNDALIELLERCNNFIDTVGRNIIYLEEMMIEIQNNTDISKRNATKANNCINYEKKSMNKILLQNLKYKAYLANFFKIGSSNCPVNPHLKELYETGRLILSYNGHFILEECIGRHLWNQEFKNKLEQAIHAEVLDKLRTPMLEQQLRLAVEKEIQCDPIIKNKIELEMSGIDKELDIISKTPFKNLIFQFMDSDTNYDWLRIAKNIEKPDSQCRRFWNLVLKPHISRAKWTKQEDDKLIEIVTKYNERNWRQIAIELDTNRNELQCFVHYQRFKKISCKKGKWTKEEDFKLSEAVKEYSVKNIINWQKVYLALHRSGRSVDQIYNRWMYCLKPGIKKGYLDEREKFIINIAKTRNLPASVVSMNLINRTPSQIRNAYRRITYLKNTDGYSGGWTPSEDKLLLLAVNENARDAITWTQVSKQVPGRNAEQCRHRFTLIEKKVSENPKLTIDDFPRTGIVRQLQTTQDKKFLVTDTLFTESDLQETFKENRVYQNTFNKPESFADRKLKKSFLDNVYITKYCNFSSKCDLLKYILDYLGTDLIVPKTFIHKDDLIDEQLMSMMTYLKVYSNKTLTLEPSSAVDQHMTDITFTYEGIHDVLRTSDIINTELSELEGLFDIRMRNFGSKKTKNINQNLVSTKKKTFPLPIFLMGSVPPNFETLRMLYTYMNNLTSSIKSDSLNDSNNISNFNFENGDAKKLHDRLVAIFRWPALLSGLVDYNSANINMIVNDVHPIDTNNYSKTGHYPNKKKLPYFNLKTFLQ